MIGRKSKKKLEVIEEPAIIEETIEVAPIIDEPAVEELVAPMPEEEAVPTRDPREIVEEFLKNNESVEYFKNANIAELKKDKLPEELKFRAAAAMLYTKAETSRIATAYIKNILSNIEAINNMEVFFDESKIADLIGNIIALRKHMSLHGELIDLVDCCNKASEEIGITDSVEFSARHIDDLAYHLERIKNLAFDSKASNREEIVKLMNLEIWNLLK